MKYLKIKYLKNLLIVFALTITTNVKADFFGGDVVVLAQLLANAVQQLVQLKEILSTGNDSLDLMKSINQGIKEGLNSINLINPKFNPGIFGNLKDANQVMDIISNLYGSIPNTSEYKLQEAQDKSASESIAMNSTLFKYADEVDIESKQIIAHAKVVNPQGAAKLTAQSLAVLIGVTTQVLRTNSMMLKMMGENMALDNRKEKIQSEQFKTQYDGLSSALKKLPEKTNLTPLGSL